MRLPIHTKGKYPMKKIIRTSLVLLLLAGMLSGCDAISKNKKVSGSTSSESVSSSAEAKKNDKPQIPEAPKKDKAENEPEAVSETRPDEDYQPGALWAANYLPTVLDTHETVNTDVTFFDAKGNMDSSEAYRFSKDGEFVVMEHEYTTQSEAGAIECKETAFPSPCARYYWDGTIKMLTLYPSWLYNETLWDSVFPKKGLETVTDLMDVNGQKAVHTIDDMPEENIAYGYSETVYYVDPATLRFEQMEISYFDGVGTLLGKTIYKWSYDEPKTEHAFEPKGIITDVGNGCRLKFVVKDGDFSEEQNFVVAKDVLVSFGITGIQGMYSDAACQNPIKMIDVTGDTEEVYVVLS